jgi:uncharacterized protein YlzI (FlbEa/FlbD family)
MFISLSQYTHTDKVVPTLVNVNKISYLYRVNEEFLDEKKLRTEIKFSNSNRLYVEENLEEVLRKIKEVTDGKRS